MENQTNPNVFHGCLRPEPYDFTLGVDQLVIRDDSISFDFHGVVDGTKWFLKGGKVEKKEDGHFYGTGYYEDQSEWRIYILGYSIIDDECYLDGLWFEPDGSPQYGYFWTFEGGLSRLQQE